MKSGLAKQLTALLLAMVLVLSCGALDLVAYATTEGDGVNSGTPAVTEEAVDDEGSNAKGDENPDEKQTQNVSVNLSVYFVFMGEGEKEYSAEAGTMTFDTEDTEQSLTFAIPAEEGYVYMVSDDEEQAKSVTDNGDGTCTVTFARPEETIDYMVYVYYKNEESVDPKDGTSVAWIGETGYPSLSQAVKAAANLDADTVTIRLESGTYTLKEDDDFSINGYFKINEKASKQNLIFVGAGRGETVWSIGGSKTDANEDDSFFGHTATITFRNMTVRVSGNYMCGLTHLTNTVVDNCDVDCSGGTIYYWGNGTATFKNSSFIDIGPYAMWAYSPRVIDITGCTFSNVPNGVINAFRYVQGLEINFTGNTVNAPNSKGVMIRIDDANSYSNQWKVNIADNTITGFSPSASTCSKLFSVSKYRTDKNDTESFYNNTNGTPSIVTLEGKTIWTSGIWTNRHDGTDGDGNLYTYGHSEYDKNIERVYVDKDGNLRDNDNYYNEDGVMIRHWVDRCKYCGFVYDSGNETQPTTATVTFKVVNGKWNDGSTEDKTVTVALTAGKGALTADQIPAVGNRSNADYQAGSWNVEPNTTREITEEVIYIYTYARSTTPIVPGDTVNYIVEHYKAGTDGQYPADPTDKEILVGKIGTTVTATAKTYEGYCLNTQVSTVSGALVEIEDDDDILVLKLYYDADSNNDDIPDKYQKKVTFKVVNGKWNDKTTADQVVYVTLEKDGKRDAIGTGALTAPADGNEPNDGFKVGSWDTTPPATVSGTDAATYTYTYARSTTPIVPGDTVNYIVEHYKAGTDGQYPADPTDKEILGGKIGTTVTATAKTYEDYCLNTQVSTVSGALVEIEDDDDILVLKLYYDADENDDEIPDKYQKKVTFKVVNGKWNDKTTADQVVYVTLEKDGKWDATGTGALTAPAVGNEPNDGFKAGSWDTTPPATVSGTDAATYTYPYAKDSVVPVDPSIPQTGDASHILLWGAMMIASMVGVAALTISNKKFAFKGK